MLKSIKRLYSYQWLYQKCCHFSTQNSIIEGGETNTTILNENTDLSETTQETSLSRKLLEELDLPYNIYGNSIDIPPKVANFWHSFKK